VLLVGTDWREYRSPISPGSSVAEGRAVSTAQHLQRQAGLRPRPEVSRSRNTDGGLTPNGVCELWTSKESGCSRRWSITTELLGARRYEPKVLHHPDRRFCRVRGYGHQTAEPRALWQAVRGANGLWLLATVALMPLAILARSWRWRTILARKGVAVPLRTPTA